MTRYGKTRETSPDRAPLVLVLGFLIIILVVLSGCTRKRPGSDGVSQLPVDETSSSLPGDNGDQLTWQVSFINTQPLTYPHDVVNTFVAGPDFTAELTFSTIVDEATFESALHKALRSSGGDPALTWENRRMVLFDVRGCNGRMHLDLKSLARKAGLKSAAPLTIYCGAPKNVLKWSADRGNEIIGTVPSTFEPAGTNSDHAAIFYHRMRAADGGTDAGVWLADFSSRSLRPLAVHYLGAKLQTAFLEGSSLVVSTGGDDLQVFGGNGIRVRQFDPEDLGLIVGMAVDERGRIAIFEGKRDESGRSGDTRLRLLDRNFVEITRVENVGRLSRLSGNWRTVDAIWLDSDTIAFIHWNNRFYGVVAIADVSNQTVTRTSIVADELSGALADGRFVVRRQAGGRAGCWRVESSDGSDTTPLCDRLPGPVEAQVSPDGTLVALRLSNPREVVVWNRVSLESRRIGEGEPAGWTAASELIWISDQETLVTSDEGGFL